MFRELTSSIKAILYERAVSPLSGVVALVWVSFNWKPLVVLFWATNDVTARIAYIEGHYVDAWRNLYYPIIVSAAILVTYPFVALLAYALWEKVASWKLELKQRFEGTVALPVSKSLAIWTEMREKDKQFNVAIEAKDDRIAELENQNQNLLSELNNLKESLSKGSGLEIEIAKRTEQLARAEAALKAESEKTKDLSMKLKNQEAEIVKFYDYLKDADSKSKELEEGELKLLSLIGQAEEKDMGLEVSEAIKRAKLTKVVGNYYIESLKNKHLINLFTDEDSSKEFLMLEQPGRALLIERGRKGRTPSKAPPPIKPVRA
jgi:hypothetical protein